MTIQTSIAVSPLLVRERMDGMIYDIHGKPVIPATVNGDSQLLLTFPNAGRLYGAHLTVPATLGGGVTGKLQLRRVATNTVVDITQSSTAATAGVVSGSGLVPTDFAVGDTVELLISGGTSAAAQTIAYDLACQHN
jgi:hypothetical protein